MKNSDTFPLATIQDGKLVSRVTLGDLEAKHHLEQPVKIGVFLPAKFSEVRGDCSRSCFTLTPQHSPCKGWKYYEGKIQLDPAVVGLGAFNETFPIFAERNSTNNGYPDEFHTSVAVLGKFHGSNLVASADKQHISEWLYGKRQQIVITISNMGDRASGLGMHSKRNRQTRKVMLKMLAILFFVPQIFVTQAIAATDHDLVDAKETIAKFHRVRV